MTTSRYDVLIVGAGISGLLAARQLVASNRRIVLLDKGRSPGGRLATRRVGPGRADHGAQFFSARAAAFRSLVEEWIQESLVYPWSYGWSDGSLAGPAPDGHPRYAVHGGMNALARSLAAGLVSRGVEIKYNVQVTSLAEADGAWLIADATGAYHHANTVVLTMPVPQALAVLETGGVSLNPAARAALERIRYAPCLCALYELDRATLVPRPGAIQRPEHDFAWIADNQAKGISPEAAIVTMHGAPGWSEQNYHRSDEALLAAFGDELARWIDGGTQILSQQIKRWRYALPTVLYPEPYLRVGTLPALYFGGDAFGTPRVEGAALSGLAIGDALLKKMQ